MRLPRIVSRLTDSGETVRILQNPPLVVGHHYLVENLRRGTFAGQCAAVQNGHVTFDLDSGDRLTMSRKGNVWKDITGDDALPPELAPERVVNLTERGSGH